jgi:glycosyltransferase involved in cell wall biosynthesis
MRYVHHPRACAALYAAVIEATPATSEDVLQEVGPWVKNLPLLAARDKSDVERPKGNHQSAPTRQLLVDVSEIARSDLHSGIERVVRAQLAQLIAHPPEGYRIEPIYLGEHLGVPSYFYARNYVTRLLDVPLPLRPEMPVHVNRGDIFYGADFCPLDVIKAAQSGIYDQWRQAGVKISFLIYDLLPILHPQFFPPTVDERHIAWLSCMGQYADQVIAISQAVASDVQDYFAQQSQPREQAPHITYVHQGADLSASVPTSGLPHDAATVLDNIASKPTFLMVGTIEPRKGVMQAISAFELLWAQGQDVQLLLVGKEGWVGLQDEQRRTLPHIMQKLMQHPELGKRFLWLPEVSDEYLQKIYGASTCLLMASEGEGFGLPLIEAAVHNCPILARDLPVFREIAGSFASYFEGGQAQDLSNAIELWLRAWRAKQLPASQGIAFLNWAQNVEQTVNRLMQ